MNKLIIISILLLAGLNGFGQEANSDTTILYWGDGINNKYWQWSETVTLSKSKGLKAATWNLRKLFFSKEGNKISSQDFLKQYGQLELDIISLELLLNWISADSVDINNNSDLKIELYNYYIKAADGKLFLKEYEVAMNYYTKAKEIKPNEMWPKEKIFEVEELMKNQKLK
ncbi:MAG: hypothetical protein COB15_00925 [Flavobacteriales bacterium]|nr:MAG: hypothetical protein COB15_00925 [Flavobacteriales bacterium]